MPSNVPSGSASVFERWTPGPTYHSLPPTPPLPLSRSPPPHRRPTAAPPPQTSLVKRIDSNSRRTRVAQSLFVVIRDLSCRCEFIVSSRPPYPSRHLLPDEFRGRTSFCASWEHRRFGSSHPLLSPPPSTPSDFRLALPGYKGGDLGGVDPLS
jgi:hypothetical protein